MKDLIHWITKNIPVSNIINFDKSAHKFKKIDPVTNILIKSKPPRNVTKPKKTTICINNFFLVSNFSDKYEKIKIGNPIIDGINEVIESLSLTKLIIIPQNIKNDPYKTEKISTLKLNILNSFILE
tara:strand:+ start:351 stop:728 length:378 start_codon:yes stop_codon:yes gene_type:complete